MEMSGQSSRRDEELVEGWRQISATVHKLRHTPVPTSTNELLREQIKSDPDGPFAAAYLLWVGDNFFQEARFEEAVEAYDELVGRYSDRVVGTKPLAAVALRQAGAAHERLGNPEEASRAYGRIAEGFAESTSVAWAHYEQGRVAEEAGNDKEALAAYDRAAKAPDVPASTQLGTHELARRAAERIRKPGEGIRPQPEYVARELARALEQRDDATLGRLASPTHFTLGVMHSERHFVEREKVLGQLVSDLQSSKVRSTRPPHSAAARSGTSTPTAGRASSSPAASSSSSRGRARAGRGRASRSPSSRRRGSASSSRSSGRRTSPSRSRSRRRGRPVRASAREA